MQIEGIACHFNGLQWAISDNAALHHADEAIRYQGCGLDNVYLVNGYKYGSLTSGEEVLHIADIIGLHRVIAAHIMISAAELDAKTLKFLRKELDMSQREVAKILGVEEQTVASWESARTPIPKHAAWLLKVLTKKRCAEATA
jgi:putative transcriptional regulator